MCEIALKFGSKFSNDEIKEVFSVRSDGEGFFTIFKNKSKKIIKNLNGLKARKEYLKLPEPLVSLYHIRNASAGHIIPENIQPFYSNKNDFCLTHNGTISRETLAMIALASGKIGNIEYNYSDSKILFELLKNHKAKDIVKILYLIKDNFIFISKGYIYIMGKFFISESGSYIVKSYSADYSYCVYDYYGKLIKGDKLKSKPKYINAGSVFNYKLENCYASPVKHTNRHEVTHQSAVYQPCVYAPNYEDCAEKNYQLCKFESTECPFIRRYDTEY